MVSLSRVLLTGTLTSPDDVAANDRRREHPRFAVSDIELRRDGRELCFIMQADVESSADAVPLRGEQRVRRTE